MNQIEALQALAEGKRIRRKVWSNKDCFLEFNDKGELVDENGFLSNKIASNLLSVLNAI